MLNLNEQTFEEEVLKSSKPVLVDFWASWCGPCQMLAPIIEELDKELQGKIKIAKVDVDKNPLLAAQYQIDAIPALFIFKDGQIIEKIIGLVAKEEIMKKLNQFIS